MRARAAAADAGIGVGPVLLVSPMAHRAGHFWPNTVKLAAALRSAGVDVTVVASGSPGQAGWSPPGVQVDTPPQLVTRGLRMMGRWRSRPSGPERLLATALTLVVAERRIRNSNPPFCAVQISDGAHLPLFWWASRSRFERIIYRAYGRPDPRFAEPASPLARLWRRVVDSDRLVVVCETEEIAEEWRPLGGRVSVIPYAVELGSADDQRPCDHRRDLGLAPDLPCFLSFGPTRPTKRIDVLLEAARSLPYPVCVLHVGKVLGSPDPCEIATAIGLRNLVVIDRFVSEDEARAYFKASDAVVLPYAPPHDRGSGVLLEACRWGRPVIASDTGYLGRFIRRFGCGLVFDIDDPATLARCMIDVLNPARWDQLARAARRAAEAHSWQAIIPRYLALLHGRNEQP